MSSNAQGIYSGLLKGASAEFKTLRNRRGSPALGPVTKAEHGSTWGTRQIRRPTLQLVSKFADLELVNGTQLRANLACSYYPHDDQARRRYALMTTQQSNSMATVFFSNTIFMAVFALIYILPALRSGKLSRFWSWVLLILVFGAFGWPFVTSYAKQFMQTIESDQESITHFKNWSPSLRCDVTYDPSEAHITTALVAYHKTLFTCIHSHLCPGERLYFNRGEQALTCPSPARLGNAGDVGAWTCAVIENVTLDSAASNVCVDARNWSDPQGLTCAAYASTHCNRTLHKLTSLSANQNWTALLAALFLKQHNTDIGRYQSATWMLSPMDACCACGGGGDQQTAKFDCEAVQVDDDGNSEQTAENVSGHSGALCGGCKPKYMLMDDGTCSSCEDEDTRYAIWVLSVSFIFVVYVSLRNMHNNTIQSSIDQGLSDLLTRRSKDDELIFTVAPGSKTSMLVVEVWKQARVAANRRGPDKEGESEVKKGFCGGLRCWLRAGSHLKEDVDFVTSKHQMLKYIRQVYELHPALLSDQAPDAKLPTIRQFFEVIWHSHPLGASFALLAYMILRNAFYAGLRLSEWQIDKYTRVLLTPANIFLGYAVLRLNIRWYMDTYGKVIKPMTRNYERMEQRLEKVSTLLGSNSLVDGVVVRLRSLLRYSY